MTERDPRMKPNRTGRCPAEAVGKRVVVELANGKVEGVEPVTAAHAAGWAASAKGKNPGCRWSLIGDPFDIAFYRVL